MNNEIIQDIINKLNMQKENVIERYEERLKREKEMHEKQLESINAQIERITKSMKQDEN